MVRPTDRPADTLSKLKFLYLLRVRVGVVRILFDFATRQKKHLCGASPNRKKAEHVVTEVKLSKQRWLAMGWRVTQDSRDCDALWPDARTYGPMHTMCSMRQTPQYFLLFAQPLTYNSQMTAVKSSFTNCSPL